MDHRQHGIVMTDKISSTGKTIETLKKHFCFSFLVKNCTLWVSVGGRAFY